jgi:uncharacterized membrane protein
LKTKDLFTPDNRRRVREAIAAAEAVTSGEVRVYVDDRCKGSELDRAAAVFEKLGMHRTAERNGVLIYVSVQDRKFAVIGDAGIHEKVRDAFWEAVRNEMLEQFKQGDIINGIVHGVRKAGTALAEYFPHRGDDRNELPDEIVFGE